MSRRRALIAASNSGSEFPLYLYNEGVISPIIGDFNTTGYKYGADSAFAQSKASTYLRLRSTSQYNLRGGRTWTGNNALPSQYIGKTLHCTGNMTNQQLNNRRTFFRLYLSESVVDASDTEDVGNSGAFVNATYSNFQFSGSDADVPAETTKTFDISLPITQAGYVSVMFYKGFTGQIDVHVENIWIE